MKKILLICVNYNSYDCLIKYLDSIRVAYSQTENLDLKVIVADNSQTIQNINSEDYEFSVTQVVTGGNPGYMGAVTFSIDQQKILLSDYDFLIISNVDLQLDKDYFAKLINRKYADNVAWIAPQIFSKFENRDRNPKMISRPSLKKMKLLKLFYKVPVLNYFYVNTIYKLKSKHLPQNATDNYIYGGHGSCMIFTNNFIKQYSKIVFPSFLFCEESFFAEEILKKDLKVEYCNDIVVYDSDHESTGKMKKKLYYKYNYDSVCMILNNYYK